MSETVSAGPLVATGNLLGNANAPDPNFHAGPSIFYQGSVLPDVRQTIRNPAAYGSVLSHLMSAPVIDVVPAASAATPVNIAAAANAVSGTAMTLVSAGAAGIALAIPFYAYGTNTLVTSAITLDLGFTKLNCTASSGTVTPTAGTIGQFQQGQWLVVGGVGNSGATIPLITQVQSIGTTTMVVSPVPQATNATAPVAQANILNPMGSGATAFSPYMAMGLAAVLNPGELVGRNIGISGSASATGGAFKVVGYDIYGQPMTETITATSGATVTYGNKGFKHIISITPQFSDAHTYSAGTGDTFSLPLRDDRFEHMDLFWAGAFISASTGWVAADATSPATSATGDVRGSVQVSGRGSQGSGVGSNTADGTRRLVIYQTIPAYNLMQATQANPVAMYGQTQA